jgi:hypothetical protein
VGNEVLLASAVIGTSILGLMESRHPVSDRLGMIGNRLGYSAARISWDTQAGDTHSLNRLGPRVGYSDLATTLGYSTWLGYSDTRQGYSTRAGLDTVSAACHLQFHCLKF